MRPLTAADLDRMSWHARQKAAERIAAHKRAREAKLRALKHARIDEKQRRFRLLDTPGNQERRRQQLLEALK